KRPSRTLSFRAARSEEEVLAVGREVRFAALEAGGRIARRHSARGWHYPHLGVPLVLLLPDCGHRERDQLAIGRDFRGGEGGDLIVVGRRKRPFTGLGLLGG